MDKHELQRQMRILANDYCAATERLEEALKKHREYASSKIIAEQIRKDGIKKIYGARPSMMVVDECTEYVKEERGF